jgi:hypothetical protein
MIVKMSIGHVTQSAAARPLRCGYPMCADNVIGNNPKY